jgi:hypothetical protein
MRKGEFHGYIGVYFPLCAVPPRSGTAVGSPISAVLAKAQERDPQKGRGDWSNGRRWVRVNDGR